MKISLGESGALLLTNPNFRNSSQEGSFQHNIDVIANKSALNQRIILNILYLLVVVYIVLSIPNPHRKRHAMSYTRSYSSNSQCSRFVYHGRHSIIKSSISPPPSSIDIALPCTTPASPLWPTTSAWSDRNTPIEPPQDYPFLVRGP